MSRPSSLLLALCLCSCGRPAPAPPPSLEQRVDDALDRAAKFLSSKQGPDGAFRSARYAAFRDGYSLSPLALTVSRLVGSPDRAAYGRGVDFIATVVQDGKVRSDEARPQYPLYAIAGGILVLNVPDNARHDAARSVLMRELRAMQATEEGGWLEADPSYGGWGYFPGSRRRPEGGEVGAAASNLSSTLFAVGALRLGGAGTDDPTMRRARTFVERCQNLAADGTAADRTYDDGGFFFGPDVPDGNKAGVLGTDAAGRQRFRSYGSMTADGVRALLQLGLGHDHPRVVAAARWLAGHWSARNNPGDFPDTSELRRESAYYYWVWSGAHALRALGQPTLGTPSGSVFWAQSLAEELISRQRTDGSWSNRYTEMREDEPLVATPFAAAALAVARGVLRGEQRTHRR
ncbi:MAG: hypothetical protein HYY06_14095 [Deltaproteobacteria bacterium]|nr:hypothetical protein [Deltaproteobacteria bacterium]